MEESIEVLKGEFLREKNAGQKKEKYILELQEIMEKMDEKLKIVTLRMEELQTKCLHYEREMGQNKSICYVFLIIVIIIISIFQCLNKKKLINKKIISRFCE